MLPQLRPLHVLKMALLAVLLLGMGSGGLVHAAPRAAPAEQSGFVNAAFALTWGRTDSLLKDGRVARSWYWGPGPGVGRLERYDDAPDGTGKRLVQYFDKSRMEINNPAGNPKDKFYVTNGLLTVELISGNQQVGNSHFIPAQPAQIPVASDADDANAPTYASFRGVTSYPNHSYEDPVRTGQSATATIDRGGNIGQDAGKASVAGVVYKTYQNKHNIPEIFWNFMNQQGLVIQDGEILTAPLSDPWFYATGLPITDAYWAHVKVGGTFVDVLIQCYERRVLTYVPSFAPVWQVQMGNIGQHYLQWSSQISTPVPATSVPTVAAPTAVPTQPPAPPQPPAPTPTPQLYVIEIHQNSYHPSELTIHVGDSVRWDNQTTGNQRIKSDDDAPVPFEFYLLSRGDSSHTIQFTVPGLYKWSQPYWAIPHGRITVVNN